MLWKCHLDQAGPVYWPVKGFCIPDDDDDAALLQFRDNLGNYLLPVQQNPCYCRGCQVRKLTTQNVYSVTLQVHSIKYAE